MFRATATQNLQTMGLLLISLSIWKSGKGQLLSDTCHLVAGFTFGPDVACTSNGVFLCWIKAHEGNRPLRQAQALRMQRVCNSDYKTWASILQ